MRKYTIVDYYGYNLSPSERMRTIKAAGFDGVVLLWADYFDADFADFPRYAEATGLFVENAHAPYRGANALWFDTLSGVAYADEIVSCIESAADFGISTIVMHPTSKKKLDIPTDGIGLDRMKRIAETAVKFGVNVALENMGSPEFIGFILDNVDCERLGFCYDSGHHRCFSPDDDLLSQYGKRLMALHLHDNDGISDLHALPFSGVCDWSGIARRLVDVGYDGAIALEVQNCGFEDIADPVEFLKIALERAKMIL